MQSQKDIKFYELELSGDCNAACPLCERTMENIPLRGNSNITLEQIKKLFPTKDTVENVDIVLCGTKGDPILNPQMLEIAQYLDQFDPWAIGVSTNGGYNNTDWWKQLGKLKNVEVDFCIDGHQQTNHLYRVNVKWETVIRNLEAFIEAGGNARWMFIPFDHNEHEYEIAKQHAEQLGIKFIKKNSARNAMFEGLTYTPRNSNRQIVVKNSKLLTNKNDKKVKEAINAYDDNDLDTIQSASKNIVCRHFKDNHVYINSKFQLSPCCYMSTDKHNKELKNNYTTTDWNDLNHYSMQEVLDTLNSFEIKNRWKYNHQNHLSKCVITCGNNGVGLHKRERII